MDIEFRLVSRESAGIGSTNAFNNLIGIKSIIGDTFAGQGVRKLPDSVMEDINDVIEDFIVDTTKQGFDADGERFQDLDPKYKKAKEKRGMGGMANLYARTSSRGAALDNFKINRDGQSNRSVGVFDYKDQEMYMGTHQTGQFPQPQRKFFPDEASFSSSHYQNVVGDVQEIIHQYIVKRMGG